jgi:hypothetical protein
MNIPGHSRIKWTLPIAAICLSALSCGEARDAPPESSGRAGQEPVVTFKITYGDEVTRQESFLLGEEVLDDVDCTVLEYFYSPPASRLSPDGTTRTKLLSGKLWISKATGEWINAELNREIMGDTVNVAVTNVLRFSAPLRVGKSRFFDRDVRLIPELRPPSRNRYRAEVVSLEDIVVPAGTFTCYRVELSVVEENGIELEDPVLQDVFWFTRDTHEEIKRETYGSWEKTETAELVSSASLN